MALAVHILFTGLVIRKYTMRDVFLLRMYTNSYSSNGAFSYHGSGNLYHSLETCVSIGAARAHNVMYVPLRILSIHPV